MWREKGGRPPNAPRKAQGGKLPLHGSHQKGTTPSRGVVTGWLVKGDDDEMVVLGCLTKISWVKYQESVGWMKLISILFVTFRC